MAATISTITTHVRGALITLPWLAWLLAADLLLSTLVPLVALADPTAAYDLSSRIAASVWLWIQSIFERLNGARVTVSGDAIPAGESAVVVANHVAWADFYMIQHLAARAGMLGRCRYFAKAQLRNVPFLGWGLWAMGMPLVSRNWERDQRELDRVFGGISAGRWPVWLIAYSEGTRLTPRKHAESLSWCHAHSRPHPGPHLLYPRTKGFVATVRQLRATAPHVRAVYDLAIAYAHAGRFQAAPPMWTALSAPGLSADGGEQGYRFHVHVRRFPMEDLPASDEELARWLEQRWVEKGKWLEEKLVKWGVEA